MSSPTIGIKTPASPLVQPIAHKILEMYNAGEIES